jgi:hypothetical protein
MECQQCTAWRIARLLYASLKKGKPDAWSVASFRKERGTEKTLVVAM